MRLTQGFIPTIKETPNEAQIASHRLMLRAGLVRQTSAGIYAWLPTGLRVLRNIERIVREEQDAIGGQEMLMPTIQSADLWRESGRYDDYGAEMLRIRDRHDRDMLYGPTNEEMITDLFRQSIRSYRELPQILYHIQWKFRDEVRPRFGVMRGREFLMKDAYSFDVDHAGAVVSYRKMMLAYMRTFQRWKPIPVRSVATSAMNSSSWRQPVRARYFMTRLSRKSITGQAASPGSVTITYPIWIGSSDK
jgi:prolyl-tRNA synthetase